MRNTGDAHLGAAAGTDEGVTGDPIDPAQLPFTTFDLSSDGRQVTVTAFDRRWSCDIGLLAVLDG